MTCELRVPDKRSTDFIAHNVRRTDEAEMRACGFPTPQMAVDYSIKHSEATFLIVESGRPVCLIGYATHPNPEARGWGVPWVIGTDAMRAHAREIAQLAATIFDTAPYVGWAGFVHSANRPTIEWMTGQLGFSMTPVPVKLGRNGEPFYGLWRTRGCPSPSSPPVLQ